MRLRGKRALVTGAGPNIGREICLALAEEGAMVACNAGPAPHPRQLGVAYENGKPGGRASGSQERASDGIH